MGHTYSSLSCVLLCSCSVLLQSKTTPPHVLADRIGTFLTQFRNEFFVEEGAAGEGAAGEGAGGGGAAGGGAAGEVAGRVAGGGGGDTHKEGEASAAAAAAEVDVGAAVEAMEERFRSIRSSAAEKLREKVKTV